MGRHSEYHCREVNRRIAQRASPIFMVWSRNISWCLAEETEVIAVLWKNFDLLMYYNYVP